MSPEPRSSARMKTMFGLDPAAPAVKVQIPSASVQRPAEHHLDVIYTVLPDGAAESADLLRPNRDRARADGAANPQRLHGPRSRAAPARPEDDARADRGA